MSSPREPSLPEAQREGIAVVGIGCRFPGGVFGPDGFWDFLIGGGDGIVETPKTRFDLNDLYDREIGRPGKLYSRHLGALGDIDGFDADFFGIARREAETLDPQQRLLLEVVWEALEHAGMAADTLAGSRTGTYVGAFSDDYAQSRLYDRDLHTVDGYTSLSVLRSLTAGRVAYQFDLHGPAMTVDTACSSSLLSIHLACRALWSGECDMALAGGVNLVLSPEVTVSLCQLRALSPTGACRAFDAAADGYVRGEGAAMVVLKRLGEAVADGDRILAVVRGSAVNHDGRSNGVSAPNPLAQQRVISAALRDAGVAPAQVSYVEAHGTGTVLGDPIEVKAIAAALGAGRTAPLAIGAVKSNIGHLEAAAGAAGFVKLSLALSHHRVPPNLHFETPNPHIPWARLPFEVVGAPTTLGAPTGRPIGAVSAFGMSGTNVHMVLEAPPPAPPREASPDDSIVLPISARTTGALQRLSARTADLGAAQAAPSPRDIAWTAGTGRVHHPIRTAIVARAGDDIARRLTEARPDRACPSASRAAPRIAFVFGDVAFDGDGLKALLADVPACRAVLEIADDILAALPAEAAHRTAIERALMAEALAALWRHFGIVPHAILGVGVGEYAAARVTRVMDHATMAALLAAREAVVPGAELAEIGHAFMAAAPRGSLKRPRHPVVSGMLARPVSAELASPSYWADHARRPHDPAAADALAAIGVDIALTFGADGVPLPTGLARRPALGFDGTRHGLLTLVAELYEAGASLAWRNILEPGQRVSLPTYPFERVACRIERGRRAPVVAPSPHRVVDVAGSASVHVNTTLAAPDMALFEHHSVFGTPALPAAAICDIVRGAAEVARCVGAVDLTFDQLIPADRPMTIQTIIAPDGGFQLFARPHEAHEDAPTGGWTRHATGRVHGQTWSAPPGVMAPPAPGTAITVGGGAIYAAIAERGVRHGPTFQAVQGARVFGSTVEASIERPGGDGAPPGFTIDPVLLDAAFVSAQPLLPDAGPNRGWLPASLSGVALSAPLPTRLFARSTLVSAGSGRAEISLLLLGDDRAPIGRVARLSFRAAPLAAGRNPSRVGPPPKLYALQWHAAERTGASAAPALWSLAGEGALRDRFAAHLRATAHRTVNGAAHGAAPDIAVVFATERVGNAARRTAAVLAEVKAIAAMASRQTRLAVVTADTQKVSQADRIGDVDGAAIWGLLRVARREYPNLDCVTLDLPREADDEALASLATALSTAPPGAELAIRGAGLLACHLVPLSALTMSDNPVVLPQVRDQVPNPDEVAVDVVASGLNFRDVLHHLGQLPDSAARMPYGLECAGRVAAVGANVTDLAPGEAVLAGLPVGSLSGHITVPRAFLARMPARLSDRDGASLPLAFITAHYALDKLAALKSGQRVLIHAAAGGVGQAAIQVAQRAGAQVFATASQAKWDFLRAQGIEHVYNSRTPDFADAILAATDGRGVDVVLNSLAGEIVTESLAALAHGGHFIEIGKMEPWPRERIETLPRGIRFTAFDLWDVKNDHALIAEMMEELVARVEDGSLHPLPVEPFPIGAATAAFQHMARARHIGKIVIDQDCRAFIRPEVSYLITGGLGALGLFTAGWLIERGAKHIVLLSRSAPDAAARERIDSLAKGASIRVVAADIADETAIAALLQRLNDGGHPLAGVVHAAGVLRDGLIANQTEARIAEVFAPKLDGAAVLDRLTRERPLDFFVIYASAASLLGNPGQAGYAAANAALDAFAEARTAAGHPTIAIDWGPWAEIGMAARAGIEAAGGVAPIAPEAAGDMLERALLSGRAQTAVLAADWSAVGASAGASLAVLGQLVEAPVGSPAANTARTPSLLAELKPLTPQERERRLRGFIRQVVARELDKPGEAVDTRQELSTLGFDSMMGIELNAALEKGLGVALSLTLTFDHPTIDAIARYILADLLSMMEQEPTDATKPTPRERTDTAVSDVDAALLEELDDLKDLRLT